MKSHYLAILLLLFVQPFWQTANAQVDTIRLDTNDLITSQLKPGLHQYVVYFDMQKKPGMKMPSLWNRQVKFTEYKGEPAIEIVQNWYSGDTLTNRYVYSISKRKNFEPIYHYTKSSKSAEAFDFENGKISGSDTVAGNDKKDLEVLLTTPTINWELDLEVFSTLPFKKAGQVFVINFYHPGGRMSPAYYTYTVTGSEVIQGVDGQRIDCWLLKIDYSEGNGAIFWISKKSKEVLKMKENFRGNYRYKIKLATPNVAASK
jgi:hypothetical protein